jgi:type IV pilus assembly protein PilE
MSHNKKSVMGFTIIEALVVAVLIAVISAVGIPIYTGYLNQTRLDNARSHVELVGAAIMQTSNRGINVPANNWNTIGITDPSDNNWTYTFNALAAGATNATITANGVNACAGKNGTYKPNNAPGSRFTGDLSCFN